MNINKIVSKIKLKRLIKNGLKVGEKLKMEKGCMIVIYFPWLIEIGSNVFIGSKSIVLSNAK